MEEAAELKGAIFSQEIGILKGSKSRYTLRPTYFAFFVEK